jgi:hypothetical protein
MIWVGWEYERRSIEQEVLVRCFSFILHSIVDIQWSSGNLNLSSRSLACLPSCLFEIHLGVTPQPLPGVTEPDYPEEDARRVRSKRQDPSWFDAQDLMVLKARTNEIVAVQPEISLFGSLKTVDVRIPFPPSDSVAYIFAVSQQSPDQPTSNLRHSHEPYRP